MSGVGTRCCVCQDISAWSPQKHTRRESFPAREPSHLPASSTTNLYPICQLLNGMCVSVQLQSSLVFENERKCVIPGSCHSGSFWITHPATALATQRVCSHCGCWGGETESESQAYFFSSWFSVESFLLRGPFPDLYHVDSPSLAP